MVQNPTEIVEFFLSNGEYTGFFVNYVCIYHIPWMYFSYNYFQPGAKHAGMKELTDTALSSIKEEGVKCNMSSDLNMSSLLCCKLYEYLQLFIF